MGARGFLPQGYRHANLAARGETFIHPEQSVTNYRTDSNNREVMPLQVELLDSSTNTYILRLDSGWSGFGQDGEPKTNQCTSHTLEL